jgi:diguanylate cyclase (GGDEF)-like protein
VPLAGRYAVLALDRLEDQSLQRDLAIVLVGGLALLAGTLAVLSSRVTRPLVELTRTARRLGGGDLAARSGFRGRDEVGTLAAAFDAMADDLQATVEELQTSRDALAHTFTRFGEALGNTHDLDGLLRTVIEAAMRGAGAKVGTALLGDSRGLDERVTSVVEGPPEAARGALEALADLADDAVQKGSLVVTDLAGAAGPALAVPLLRGERTIGALAVAREVGGHQFDDLAVQAVQALAAHAGSAVTNVRAHEETRRLSVTDPLTGAGNFRQLSITLAREVERASRFSRPLSVLMLDLDHFKLVNDTQGHAFGDAVLREFARRLQACLREVDSVARCGGEEFAVVLPETSADGASAVAARLVEAVRVAPFVSIGHSRCVTVSAGVASFPDHGRTSSEVMRAADAALYSAKRTGRDRWCVAGPAGTPPVLPATHSG